MSGNEDRTGKHHGLTAKVRFDKGHDNADREQSPADERGKLHEDVRSSRFQNHSPSKPPRREMAKAA